MMNKLQQQSIVRISEQLYNHRFDGYSVNLVNGYPTTGFMVSLPDYEEKVDAELPTDVIMYQIQRYVNAHYDLVGYSKALFFGIWLDGGYYYLDVSEQLQDREMAARVAKLNNQIAYYDVKRKQSVKI
jgi:hypothetical protein